MTSVQGRPDVVTIGVIGVGEISSAVVQALATGPHRDRLRFLLSPRSAARSASLDERHDTARVAESNQAVVDGADVIVLSVLPHQIDTVCRDLSFTPAQTVVGVAAGWPPSRLAPLVAPAGTACQLIPLPMIALHIGPILLYPRIEAVADLLDGCGTLVVPESEADIAAFSCASAVMSSYFAAQNVVIDWLARSGSSPQAAKEYVTALLSGFATESARADMDALAGFVARHETPGGLNEQLRTHLESAGLLHELTTALDALSSRVHGG